MISDFYDALAKEKVEKASAKKKENKPNKKEKLNDSQKEIAEIRQELMLKLQSTKSTVTFEDVIGIPDAKKAIQVALCRQNIFIRLFKTKQLVPCKGIMLFGYVKNMSLNLFFLILNYDNNNVIFIFRPPGTGKSMLAKAAANKTGCKNFFQLGSGDLLSKYVGSSEKRIIELFKMAAELAPSVIYFGETFLPYLIF